MVHLYRGMGRNEKAGASPYPVAVVASYSARRYSNGLRDTRYVLQPEEILVERLDGKRAPAFSDALPAEAPRV